MKIKLFLSIFFLIVFMTSFVLAADSLTYDFDDINVLYATTFIAHPIEEISHSNTWVNKLVDVNSDEPNCGLWRGSYLTSDECAAEFDGDGARKYNYQCYDGTESKLGDDSSCKSKQDWEQMAEQDCRTRCSTAPSKKLVVTYGVVELKKDNKVLATEEFIKIGQGENAKRFLLNSASYNYYWGTEKFSQIISFFWSAKKLEGTSIIKDKTKPIYSSCFSRKFDENGNRYSFFLSFSDEGDTHSQECTSNTKEMMFEANINTIEESGDATARSI